MTTKQKLPKLPKNVGAAADGLWKLQERYSLMLVKAEALKKAVTTYKQAMLKTFRKAELKVAGGKHGLVTLVDRDEPIIEDYMALWAYARKQNAPELFQKRLSVDAVRERWNAGKKIPGVGKFHNVFIQVRGRKEKIN